MASRPRAAPDREACRCGLYAAAVVRRPEPELLHGLQLPRRGSQTARAASTHRSPAHLADNLAQTAYFASLGLSGDRTEPSGGYVNYVSYNEALGLGLAAYINDQVFLGADSLGVVGTGTGRNSIRLESKRAFDEGLLIADIARMPGNACGMWPALYGPPGPCSARIGVSETNTRVPAGHSILTSNRTGRSTSSKARHTRRRTACRCTRARRAPST